VGVRVLESGNCVHFARRRSTSYLRVPPSLPVVTQDSSDLRERLLETLGTTYDFERELGGGGMSRVFVAVERRFERRVVVKVLASELAAGVSAERFAREVMLAARLQQANIVPVFDSGEIGGLPFYTMPWIEGESLRTRLDARGGASISETVAVVSDVAKALSYAHAHGVVHRDIKPENVLLSGHTAVVTDFGIAKAITAARTVAPFETLTQVGTSLGTPAYMAPEQAMGDPATDHRADLYALGVVAYELLAGERPFTASSLHELVRAHVTQEPSPIASRRPDVPPALAALVMRCLEKSPDDRPQSADEVLQSLERLHELPSGERTAGAARTRRPIGARAAAVAGLVTLAVVLTAGILWWRRDRAPVATLDPGRVLVATPVASDPSLRQVASMSQSAISRALGELQSVRLAEVGAGAAGIGGDADASATHAARTAQAGTVVAANIYPLGADSVRLDLRVLDANSGDLVRAIRPIRVARGASDSAWTAALDPLLATLAITTFPWLGAQALPVGEPPRFAAVREMLTGIGLISRGDSVSRAAMQLHSTRATVIDSTFLQAQLWRGAEATTAVAVGYSSVGRAMMDTAILVVGAQRDRLSPLELTLFDYISAVRGGDQGAMLAALRRMQEIAPDVILARNLPNRLLDVNRPREALALLQSARSTRGLDGQLVKPSESPLRWATLADLYHYLGDHRAERDATAQLRRIRPDDPLTIRFQLKAAAALHDSAEVERLLADARPLPAPAQSYDFFGDLELQAGQELEAHDQAAFGRALVRRAVEWFDAQPVQERTWRMRVRHATAYHELHDETRALAILQTVPEVLDSTNLLYVGLRGRIAAAAGDTATARRIDSTLAARGRGLGGANTLERAFIASNLGQRDRAVTLLQEAFAQGYGFTIRWRLHWLTDTRPLRGYPPFDQLLQPQG
jgi:Protein kinase domain